MTDVDLSRLVSRVESIVPAVARSPDPDLRSPSQLAKATWGDHPKAVVIKALTALLPKINATALCPDNSTPLTAFVKTACKELAK